MTAKLSGSIRGRVALSQRAWTLPDGTAAGWWSLAPGRDPGGDRHAREAARQIPAEHRETAWLRDDHGRTWWALLDARTDRAAYASTRDELPADVEPEPVAERAEPVAVVTEPEHVEDPPAVEPTIAAREERTMSTIEQTIVSTLRGFGVHAEVAEVQRGAAVDRYALTLAPGTKTSAVTSLSKDIALSIGAADVRILAPIPGTKHVGVEIPAEERRTVPLDALTSDLPADHALRIPVGLAVDGSGVSARIDHLPHLLIAGTTGSGKSVWLTSILAHLATTASPAQVQMMLIDPKRVELSTFAGIRHLAAPVATDTTASIELLDAAVTEMESRYDALERAGKRNIFELGANAPPHLVVAIEEMADLMMTAGKRAESAIVRLLQVGRAAGVHLLLATQRPSADVVTGLIRANVPSRLVFAVQSHHDSKIALGQTGAQALLGAGDVLWWPSGASAPERVQAPYASTEELDEILAPLRVEAAPEPVEDVCGVRGVEVPGRDHVCECSKEAHPKGSHRCDCGAYWNTPTAPPVPAPVKAAPIPTAPVEDVEEKPEAPGGPLPVYQPPASFEVEHLIEQAYAKGRAHAEIEMTDYSMRERALRQGDYWLAALAAGTGTLAGVFIFPLLPILLGIFAAWLTLRHRRRDLTPQPYPPRRPGNPLPSGPSTSRMIES